MAKKLTKFKIVGIVLVSILLLSLFHFISLVSIFGVTNDSKNVDSSNITNAPLKLVSDIQEKGEYTSKAISGLFFVLKEKLDSLSDQNACKFDENNSKKHSLLKYITQDPGITFRELHRATGFAMGVIQYHLNHLEKKEVESLRFGRGKHFFLKQAKFSDQEKILLALLRNTKITAYLSCFTENGNNGYRQIDLVKLTGFNKYIISYYTKQLLLHGIITRNHNRLYLCET